MNKINLYNSDFYSTQMTPSYQSANEIVPILIDLFNPKSVIDVGCGMGTWLKAFLENGIEDILGVDGDYIDLNKILIPKNNFLAVDLKSVIQINRKFDLLITLEVAEHLPENSAELFIDTISQLSSIVYFSAAIPFQGGTHHINEQWQSYWAAKFASRNFLSFDIIRPVVWKNEKVETWYAQNGIIYINKKILSRINFPEFDPERPTDINNLDKVHPKQYEDLVDPKRQTVRTQFGFFKKVLVNRLQKHLGLK